MGTKSPTITGEAYERLCEPKREGERFSETILRLTGAERDVMAGFGAMADVDGFREVVEGARDEIDAAIRERGRDDRVGHGRPGGLPRRAAGRRDVPGGPSGRPVFAPSLALFEVYRGAARTGGREWLDRVASALDWIEPLPLTDATAREAVLVETEFFDAGTPIILGGVLIAGVCRHTGARIVTRDDHDADVPELDAVPD